MLQSLIELGQKLETQWHRESFPDLARKTLENFSSEVSLPDFEVQIADWLNSKDLPPQLNLYNNFGEPSLTLFNNGKFAVDIYFWRKNDTLIHSHGFRGAFKILYGVSLHEDFKVETSKNFSKDLMATELTQKSIRVMKPGDVQQINPDIELTHRVVHLDDPTVSLCLRTVEDVTLNQWHHLSTGLSFQKKHVAEKTIKQMLYFQYLLNSDSMRAQSFYLNLLDQLDTSSQISLYESLCFDQMGLEPSTSEVAAEILYYRLQDTEWFELYEKHHVDLEQNLQELQAQSPALKFLAFAINSGFTKKQTTELLEQFSNQKVQDLCDDLKKETVILTEGYEGQQLESIERFKNS